MGQTPKNHFLVSPEVAKSAYVFIFLYVSGIYFDMIDLAEWQLSGSNHDFSNHTQQRSNTGIRNCDNDTITS